MIGKRIFINGITLEKAIIAPLLTNVRYWQAQQYKITFFGNGELKRRIDEEKIINEYMFIEIKNSKKITSRLQFIFEALRRNLIALFYLRRIMGAYDIVYSRSSVLDLIIFPFVLKFFDKRIKWVTVFDNIVPFNDPGPKFIRFLGGVFFRISLLCLRRADKIFTISQELKSFLLKQGFREEKLVVTGNAVENDLIARAKEDSRYNIDALFVGRINETKGIYDMLNVLEIIRHKIPKFQLAIVGDGDEITVGKFKKRIKQKNLERNVKMLGYKAGIEKFSIIKSSKCFWFFSQTESFGIALLEAVCCGLPAFTYDLKPYKYIYQNNEIMTFKNGDFESIAEKVIELFEKGNFSNADGELLLKKYSWEKIAEIEANAFSSF